MYIIHYMDTILYTNIFAKKDNLQICRWLGSSVELWHDRESLFSIPVKYRETYSNINRPHSSSLTYKSHHKPSLIYWYQGNYTYLNQPQKHKQTTLIVCVKMNNFTSKLDKGSESCINSNFLQFLCWLYKGLMYFKVFMKQNINRWN